MELPATRHCKLDPIFETSYGCCHLSLQLVLFTGSLGQLFISKQLNFSYFKNCSRIWVHTPWPLFVACAFNLTIGDSHSGDSGGPSVWPRLFTACECNWSQHAVDVATAQRNHDQIRDLLPTCPASACKLLVLDPLEFPLRHSVGLSSTGKVLLLGYLDSTTPSLLVACSKPAPAQFAKLLVGGFLC